MKNEVSKASTTILIILAFMPIITLVVSSNNTKQQLILIIEFFLLVYLYVNNLKGETKKTLLIFAVNVVSLFFTICLYSPIGSAIIFINTILCFRIFNNIQIDKKIFLMIHSILGMTLSIYLFSIERPMYTGNSVVDRFGNHVNTNLISILFLCAFLHISCVILQFITEHKKKIIILALCAMIYGVNVWFYEARSAMISMVVFGIIVITKKKGFTYNKYKKICFILFTISLVFPFVYLGVIDRLDIPLIAGKSINTRVGVWGNCINIIKDHFILGCGNDIRVSVRADGSTTDSMHNTMLSLWKILGIAPALTFLFYCINHVSDRCDKNKNQYAQAAFISTIPVCFFESFYTEELLYMAFLPFLLVNITENIEEKTNE